MSDECALAWQMMDRFGKQLPLHDQHVLAMDLAAGDFREAIELVLDVLIRRGIDVPVDLREPLRSWTKAYRDHGRHAQLDLPLAHDSQFTRPMSSPRRDR